MSELIDANEVAAMLAVPVTWVRDHTRSGELPHLTLGRYKRYRRQDVLDWLDTLTNGDGPRFKRYAPTNQSGRRR